MNVNDQPDPQEVAAALHVSIGLLAHRLRQVPVQEELTMPEISALSRLERAGPATPGAMANAAQISPQGMGATLAALEERGYVRRQADPTDGRRVLMSVTDAGRRMLRNKKTARAEQLGKALSEGFTRGDLKTLMAAAKLIERLGEAI
jgi:DNA-binding MarR family transcriptional regulator